MSDQEQDFDLMEDELTTLKARADVMGIKYHPNIGLETLKGKIEDHAAEDVSVGEVTPAPTNLGNKNQASKKKEASKLVRVMITCMNPMKNEWEGEIFSAGNSVVGTYKKYIPFGVEWHVPTIILKMIENRQCQVFQTKTDKRTGQKSRTGKLIKEFAVSQLPALTEQELKDLAQRQAMANGTADAA